MKRGIKFLLALAITAAFLMGGASLASASPTCSATLGIAVHGQHIVGDYVSAIGGGALGWPPSGQVGEAVAGSGAAVPGGPGPGFHFEHGFAPGASFCLEQSRSPGNHPGLG